SHQPPVTASMAPCLCVSVAVLPFSGLLRTSRQSPSRKSISPAPGGFAHGETPDPPHRPAPAPAPRPALLDFRAKPALLPPRLWETPSPALCTQRLAGRTLCSRSHFRGGSKCLREQTTTHP